MSIAFKSQTSEIEETGVKKFLGTAEVLTKVEGFWVFVAIKYVIFLTFMTSLCTKQSKY